MRCLVLLGLLCGLCVPHWVAAQESARYRVEISLNWDVADPSLSAHWSRLIGFAHSARYALFADGATASSGLALLATNGRVSVLQAELSEAQRRGRAGVPVVQPGLDAGVGIFTFELDVDEKLNRISFATMLAPSPDWFAGISGVALHEDGRWRTQVHVPLWPWDAGADSGEHYTDVNVETQPRQSVRLLTHPDFLTPEGLLPIGQASFTRLR